MAMMRTIALALLVAASSTAQAAPQLATMFADHAVLQRGQAIPIWGSAAPREKVTVSLGGATKVVTANKNGAWRVDLPPMQTVGRSS
jgi:sialate O-acetylesterase